MEVAETDLEFVDGQFRVVGTPAQVFSIQEAAFAAFTAHNLPEGLEPNLTSDASYDPTNFTFPFGAHIAVVEIDGETGFVELLRYVAVDDCGNQINPLIVEGQVQGGILQGIAQALWEEARFDEQGNLRTASLTDYLVPSAAEAPNMELDSTVTPSPTTAMGVKGIGEAGTIAATPAVMNAVIDALGPLGITDIDMPASPERVWTAIREAAP
jgi:carbon-monoxide dehydrogenase large subunit